MKIDTRIAIISLLVGLGSLVVGVKQCQIAELPVGEIKKTNEASNKWTVENTSNIESIKTTNQQTQDKSNENYNIKRNFPSIKTEEPTYNEIGKPSEHLPIRFESERNANYSPKIQNEEQEKPVGNKSEGFGCIVGETDADIQWFDAPLNHTQSKEPLIPAGTKVVLGTIENGMRKITLPDGRRGWVPCQKIKSCQ